jgi:hypothetical protein
MSARGHLYICPVVNAMGPVRDPRHSDLLTTWEEVDRGVARVFDDGFRRRYPDSEGRPAVFSWFIISWSGFRSNPVHRDFGWFTIYDHYRQAWGERMRAYGDDIYWMYNHPPASGVGNEWGLDWLENAHYIEILMRFVAERRWFPGVTQVVTEKNDASHFLENFFPYDLSNRNSVDVDWYALNADGKPMHDVIDWRRATHQWDVFSPHPDDYQSRGWMRRKIGRLLDIKSIVCELKEFEIEKAFQHCLEGRDAMLSAYEHDFRDRAATIEERLLEPTFRIAKRYPEVRWTWRASLDAFNRMAAVEPSPPAVFSARLDRSGHLLLVADASIFGTAPFTFFRRDDDYRFMPSLRVGSSTWLIPRHALPPSFRLFVACNNAGGRSTIQHFEVDDLIRTAGRA